MSKLENPVYAPEVIEFVRTANQYCLFLERKDLADPKLWIESAHKLLPELYFRAVSLPALSPAFEELNQRSVTEEEYENVRHRILKILGEADAFEEVFNPNRIEAENSVGESIAENLSDIYQDVKDFLLLYEDGSYEVMYEAIWEVRQSFEQFWGQKLTNTLRAVHYLNYSADDLDDLRGTSDEKLDIKEIDTSNWIISKQQEDFQNNE